MRAAEVEERKKLNEINDYVKQSLPSEIWRARGILITVSAFYGTNFGCVKILNEAIDPSIAALCRFSIAAAVFLPKLIKIIKTNPDLVRGGLEIGAYSSLGYWAQSNALETTGASVVAFICSLAVIVVPILDKFFGDKESKTAWYMEFIAPLMATVGVGCLELGGSTLPGVGSLWALLQPLFFGLGFWRIEKIMKLAKKPGDTQGFTGAMMLCVAVFSLVWTSSTFFGPSFGDGGAMLSALATQSEGFSSPQVLAALAWTGIVTTALTSYGENVAMKQLSAAESTVIYSTEPLWGTAFAAITLGEHIGSNTIVGAAFILSACLWSSVGPKLSIVGIASSEALLESLAEVSENISTNWIELLKKWT
jgi:drug/metabolite transporter (DMT)-like permease